MTTALAGCGHRTLAWEPRPTRLRGPRGSARRCVCPEPPSPARRQGAEPCRLVAPRRDRRAALCRAKPALTPRDRDPPRPRRTRPLLLTRSVLLCTGTAVQAGVPAATGRATWPGVQRPGPSRLCRPPATLTRRQNHLTKHLSGRVPVGKGRAACRGSQRCCSRSLDKGDTSAHRQDVASPLGGASQEEQSAHARHGTTKPENLRPSESGRRKTPHLPASA